MPERSGGGGRDERAGSDRRPGEQKRVAPHVVQPEVVGEQFGVKITEILASVKELALREAQAPEH
jgi:hypothetical protein